MNFGLFSGAKTQNHFDEKIGMFLHPLHSLGEVSFEKTFWINRAKTQETFLLQRSQLLRIGDNEKLDQMIDGGGRMLFRRRALTWLVEPRAFTAEREMGKSHIHPFE